MKYKKTHHAFILTMPKKLQGANTVFPISFTSDNGRVEISVTNNPLYTKKIKQIIVTTYS